MEIVVEPVVSFLVEKLGNLLIQEAISLIGLRAQVEWIETELGWMRSFLKDADAEQQGDERAKKWVRDVHGIAYDTEDVIDSFLLKVESLRGRGSLCSIKRCAFIVSELIARHKIASKIKHIKLKIDDISKRRTTYGIESIGRAEGSSSAGRSLQEWRLTSPNVQEPDFVGFEKDLEALVMRLTEGELRRCVVSVVGMGGLGKTTLTKKLYNTDSVKKHFHTHAWISVSQEYDVRDLLGVIVKRCLVLSNEELEMVEKMNVVELRDKISEYLNHKRYLVVLDDIWKGEAWDSLKDAFPDMNNGSRIVLTTRNKDVALYADARSQPHELRFLNNEESWKLFRKKAFPGQDGGCPRDLEVLGREIVEKCHCLPLAIVVIGGLLSRKEPREWENVCKTISWQFIKGDVKISSILSLSYNDLPHRLKPCFLYLGNFPEDYEFHTMELIRMWAAEGFLQQRGEETLEEVGEMFLKELIQRCMVQVAKRSSSGGIKSFRVHDLLRDLSISEAKEGKFLEVHHGNMNVTSASRARRLAIHHNDLSKYNSLTSSSPHVRSVLIYTQGYSWLQRKQEKFLYRGFKLLRVLCLHGAPIEKLPTEIGELVHLRYLGCTKTFLKSLPSSIGNLPSLQTLSVASFDNIKVPSTIGKMRQLRHLQVKGVDKLNYLGWVGPWGVIEGHPRLDQMSNLQTLSHVKAGKWMQSCLGKLTNLRKLGIGLVTGADAEVFNESIANLGCLQSLSIVTQGFEYKNQGSLVPLSPLLKLSKLRLEGSAGDVGEAEKPSYSQITFEFI
ncbi:putative disease resistance RPP13-like protein 3 isoform X2 [Magnolia sinica]|uniref:putative disease resistance RPP13-like protein 3 isoform X2 n=1 Tax=Magnolia sinica TaxID=86752 RepID=UPI002659884F|nr:putative disease resistance RPP13-like protein 3 isoform X2 [Magnolia sinica]